MKKVEKFAATLVVMAAAIGMMGCNPTTGGTAKAPEEPQVKQTVATPVFSVVSGVVDSGTEVTISSATEGASIYFTTDGSNPTASSTQGTSVTVDADMTIKAIAVKDGMNDSQVASVSYIESSTGFLEGAGTVAKANIEIANTPYEKTGEVVIIPAGKKAVIKMTEDSSWNTFVTPPENVPYWKGVFIKDRKVTLSPFVMSQYEVTQELYTSVIGSNPSYFKFGKADGEEQELRPVEKVSHYEAVAFCNELTKKTMTADDVVYFSNEAKTAAYTTADATAEKTPYMDITKKGYRLPTEAEWEYAARGGNPQSAEWKNAFGKVTTKDNAKVYDGSNHLSSDDNLATVGWYSGNSSNKTHEVGLKEKNSLNLYDMQGNVWEWCWDWYDDVTTGTAADPVGAAAGSLRCLRGGGWGYDAYICAVSFRGNYNPGSRDFYLGFRVCRSAQ